jgi:hypothetical protein
MAVVAATVVTLPDTVDERGMVKIIWSGLANGDTGAPVACGRFADRSVQVKGTFGASGSVSIQGSLDADGSGTFDTLVDQSDNNLTITTAKIESVQQLTQYIRPNVTAGDGTTSLTVTLYAKGF